MPHIKPPAVTKLACLLALIWTFVSLVVSPEAAAQPMPAAIKGLVLYQDPQTHYVEAFEYLSSAPVNAYVTGYVLPGGISRQAHDAGILKTVEFPVQGAFMPPAAQLQGALADLDVLTKRYPQYATLFDGASTRFRNALVVAQQSATPDPRPTRVAATAGVSSPPPPTPSASAGPSTMALALKNGTRYQDVNILHADGDRFTIRHQKGITEVLFRDLPTDAKSLPPAVQTLLKTYQDEAARAEAERKQAQVAPAAQPGEFSTNGMTPAVNAANAPAFPPPPSSLAASSKGHNAVLPGLTVKGICIGMDGVEAAQALIAQGQGKLTVEPTPIPGQHGYEVYLVSHSHKASGMIGHLRTDPEDNTLTMFIFEPMLSNLLFNTADQSAEEFAKAFIDAYDVPTIEPTTVGSRTRCWSHASAEGWTLYIYTDKAIQVMRTPERKFD